MKLELWQIVLGVVLLITAFAAGLGVVFIMTEPEPEEPVAQSGTAAVTAFAPWDSGEADSGYQLTEAV